MRDLTIEEATEAVMAEVHAHTARSPELEEPDDDRDAWANVAGWMPEPAARLTRDERIAIEADRLRVRREAAQLVATERLTPPDVPPVRPLDEFLAEHDESPAYRIEQVLPSGGNVLLVAQYKAGKSTLVGNLLRSLAAGTDFLDAFPVRPPLAVGLLDLEIDERTLRRWLRDQGIEFPGAVRVVSLRGRVSSLDVLDPVVRSAWAAQLADVDVLVIDPLRPLMDALGLDENHDAGRLLVALDELKAEAGIDELVLVHHAGHGSERSRGDSRLLDWPDVSWKLVRESDDPRSPRYFSAFGRDVDVQEGSLTYEPESRRLTFGQGSRVDTAQSEALADVLALLEDDCLSGRAIESRLESSHNRAAIRSALRAGRENGSVTVSRGARGAHVHCRPEAS